ncbi:hypothetical protein [Echinicola pacifica]|uniref:hypothetical protein n=1 Tax=Echinicola pacifica TaxID=346377 RepID=UPI0003801D21|nr:hypothetical protein [Echinicola pacifica]
MDIDPVLSLLPGIVLASYFTNRSSGKYYKARKKKIPSSGFHIETDEGTDGL